MIHYTLLPEKEMKSLRTEYRIRIFIVLMFFISSVIFIGICSLLPSYILSYSQEKESLLKMQTINNTAASKDNDQYSKELSNSSLIIKKLKFNKDTVIISDHIKEIVLLKNNLIRIDTIQVSKPQDASSTLEMILQGKADTRESLLDFKKILEEDSKILKVDSPVSNLTKNKDIEFAFRIKFK